jgi:hypothetical protein
MNDKLLRALIVAAGFLSLLKLQAPVCSQSSAAA